MSFFMARSVGRDRLRTRPSTDTDPQFERATGHERRAGPTLEPHEQVEPTRRVARPLRPSLDWQRVGRARAATRDSA